MFQRTDDDVRESLKDWAHSEIDRGAELQQIREAFLGVAASFHSDETSEAFGARAALVHARLPSA